YTAGRMDNDFSVDLDEIISTLKTSELVTMRFVVVGQRLLLDFRATELDGPMVRIVEPVKSVQERYAALKKLRPRFQPPPKIVSIWWPRFVESMESTGVKDVILERVADAGHPEAVRAAEATLLELLELERSQKRNAVVGEGFKTLWSASPTRR
ncbi:MAG: hypothetical protein WEC33_08040, partial [Dehalococcoidia bacterium]